MKWLLIMTTWNSQPYSYDVSRHEVRNEVHCQQLGKEFAKDLLSKIPGIRHIHYECVKKEYGS